MNGYSFSFRGPGRVGYASMVSNGWMALISVLFSSYA